MKDKTNQELNNTPEVPYRQLPVNYDIYSAEKECNIISTIRRTTFFRSPSLRIEITHYQGAEGSSRRLQSTAGQTENRPWGSHLIAVCSPFVISVTNRPGAT
jgi:hypothetical protein